MNAYLLTVSLLLGGGIGVLTGFFGAGGGFILTPALHIFLGMSMPLAVGTGAAQICGTSAITLCQRVDRRSATGADVALWCAAGIFPGCFLGEKIVRMLARNGAETADRVLLAFFCALLFLIGAGMLLERTPKGEERGWLRNWRIPPLACFKSIPGGAFSVPVLVTLGAAMGVLSGLLGIGGGVVMLPALLYLVGQPGQYATLTTTMLVFLSSAASSVLHFRSGAVDLIVLLPLLAGALIGSRLGVLLQKRCPTGRLKKSFAWVVMAAWLLVTVKLWGQFSS